MVMKSKGKFEKRPQIGVKGDSSAASKWPPGAANGISGNTGEINMKSAVHLSVLFQCSRLGFEKWMMTVYDVSSSGSWVEGNRTLDCLCTSSINRILFQIQKPWFF